MPGAYGAPAMIRAAFAALLTLALTGGGDSGAGKEMEQAPRPQIRGTITFHEQIIIVRTPMGARPAAPTPAPHSPPPIRPSAPARRGARAPPRRRAPPHPKPRRPMPRGSAG